MITSIPSPDRGVWYLGPLPLRAYAFAIIIGVIIAWKIAERRYAKKGGDPDVVADAAGWMVLFAIVGARLYHVFTTPEPYFGPNGDLMQILRVWEGGLGIWGGVLGGVLGAWIALKRRGLRLSPFADAAAPGILAAQAVGRLGNYFNQELYGRPTDLPWALEIDPDKLVAGYPPGTTFHPTFLYEMICSTIGVFLLLYLEKRFRLRAGQVFWAYVMIYTAARFWIENLRIDTAHTIAGLRLNVWTSIIVFLLAVVMLYIRGTKVAADPSLDSIELPGHEHESAEADASAKQAAAEKELDGHNTPGSLTSDESAGTADDSSSGSAGDMPGMTPGR